MRILRTYSTVFAVSSGALAWRTTVVSVASACVRWTITAHGMLGIFHNTHSCCAETNNRGHQQLGTSRICSVCLIILAGAVHDVNDVCVVARVNNCVGEGNRWVFVQLVLYAMLMSGTALLLLLYSRYLLPACLQHQNMVRAKVTLPIASLTSANIILSHT